MLSTVSGLYCVARITSPPLLSLPVFSVMPVSGGYDTTPTSQQTHVRYDNLGITGDCTMLKGRHISSALSTTR